MRGRVLLVGVSLGLALLSSCSSSPNPGRQEGDVSRDTTEINCDTIKVNGKVDANEVVNHVANEPAEIDGVTQPEDPNDNRDCRPDSK